MPQTLTEQLSREQQIAALEKDWATNPRWKGIKRGYSAADVVRLRGSFPIEHTLARRGAEKLWDLVNTEPYVNCLGALTGGQAMQQVKAGVKAISGTNTNACLPAVLDGQAFFSQKAASPETEIDIIGDAVKLQENRGESCIP